MANLIIPSDTAFALGAAATHHALDNGNPPVGHAGLGVMLDAYAGLRGANQAANQLLQQTRDQRDVAHAHLLATSVVTVMAAQELQRTADELQRTQNQLDELRNSCPVRLANRCQQIAKAAMNIVVPAAITLLAYGITHYF